MTMERHQFFTFYALISFSLLFDFSFAYDSLTPTQSMGDDQTLVSPGQHYELGFFSPGSSKNRYLGIWHKKTPGTVVWVANRNNPIIDSYGVLTISNSGIFLLNQTKIVIWSSNLSREAESPVAELLDSGNLIVRENISMNSESYLWQSFDYPSNTRLPGMKMGWNSDANRDQYLTSWKNEYDPSLGDFTYRIDNHGLPQLVISSGSVRKFRSGLWNGLRFNGLPMSATHDFEPILVFKDGKLYYMYEPIHDSSITRLTLNQSGSLQRYILNERSAEWALVYVYPNDMCDSYGQCGANGICRINNLPICECLKGYKPKSQEEWDGLDWSSGCVRSVPSTCQSGEGFVKVKNVKLPDLLKFRLNTSMSLKECEAQCLKNCSCTAYANSNISGESSDCLIWFGDLIDIREITGEGNKQDIYIRLPASELESNSDSKNKRLVAILVASIISGMLLLSLALWCIIWKKRTKRRGLGSKKEDLDLPLFDLATIAAATDNFSHTNMIGAGGFGPVYKGNLPSGQEIAVKRLSKNSGQGVEEFKNEIILIAKLQHRNLVKLLGCCIQGEETMLIYEYMPNKSLDYFIFDQNKSVLLSWQKRFDIAIGIARGLLYLHQDSRLRIIHRDLKASNILLDSDLNPKISDFGLARIFGGDQIEEKTKRVMGTYGYMSPEYAIDGNFSMKSDVFSLGVLLLEIVSGKRNRRFHHPDHHHNLLGHAWLLWIEDRAIELMDACLLDSCVESQVLRYIHVGLLCVQKLPQDRPAMSFVVFMLGNEGAMLPQPKQPGFFIERSSIDTDTTSNKEKFLTEDARTITILEPR